MALTTADGSLTFTQLVSADLAKYTGRVDPWWKALYGGFQRPGVWASLLLRAQQRILERGHPRLAGSIRGVMVVLFSLDVGAGARIGPGLRLEHPTGVVIGPEVVIGSNVMILQGVTLGVRDPRAVGRLPHPVIEDDVLLGAHCGVFGGVTVGEGAVVATKATVFIDVPAGGTAVGTPARLL